MKVFNYLGDSKGIAEKYRIYKEVWKLKPYAISKYKSWWEDALEEAFFHILDNYDASKGNLENYTTKIVGTIYLNKNRKEVANEEKTILELDLQEAEDYKKLSNGKSSLSKSPDLSDCIREIIPYFVKDFKFFQSSQAKDRKLDYGVLFKKYTYETIAEAKEYLVTNYGSKVDRLIGYAKNVTLKSFSDDRYTKSFDAGVEYEGVLNDIVIIRRCKGSHAKKLYSLPIDKYINTLIKLFYCDESFGKAVIEGIGVYVSIAGNIVIGEKALRKYLENELVGSVLSRSSLKVVKYDKGKELLLSSTRDEQHDIILPMFGKDIRIRFDRVVCKEVNNA